VLTRAWKPRDAFPPEQIDFMRALYDGGIRAMDHDLEGLFATIHALGLLDNTLIVFTSDHGEEFLEHHLFLHHQNAEEVARVPLLVRLPNGRGAGLRIPALASTLDIAPTILAAVGVPAAPAMEGRNLLQAIDGAATALPFVYIAGAVDKLRTGEWSMFMSPNDEPASLYDLRLDPGETKNVLAAHRDVADRLRRLLLAERARQRRLAAAHPNAANAAPSEEERAKLRALGY
jgi:arylsulfatase A-like enzyme